jgi:hypothetical protein
MVFVFAIFLSLIFMSAGTPDVFPYIVGIMGIVALLSLICTYF